MKSTLFLVAMFALPQLAASPAPTAPTSQPAARTTPAKTDALAALEKKLLGPWKGPACAGDFTFKADGTYECRNFTPGNNTLTGEWSLRWDAVPPTLVLLYKTSDFKKKDPTRPEYEYVGKPLELRVTELNDETFVYRFPDEKLGDWRNTRPEKE
jgi:hypothetical protein